MDNLIPIIKIINNLNYSNSLEEIKIEIKSNFEPIQIKWGSNTFHIRSYEIRNFISQLEIIGYKLESRNTKITIGRDFGEIPTLSKVVENFSLHLYFNEKFKISNETFEHVFGFLKQTDIFELLGIGGILDNVQNDEIHLNDISIKKSNDYRLYEKLINFIIPHDINNTDFKSDFEIQEVLATISLYNSKDTIAQVLYALDNQNVEDKFYDHFQLIMIDDNSDDEIIPFIKSLKFSRLKNFSFIKNYQNLNQGQVLNEAWINAKENQEIFLSLDTDIIIQQNYLKNHLCRMNLYQSISTHSCREASDDENLKSVHNLSKIYRDLVPDYKKDSRYHKVYDANLVGGIGEIVESFPFEESDYYCSLGNNKKIKGNVDLQMLYKGHNFVVPAAAIRAAAYAGRHNVGWGDEDGYIGRKIIAAGAFIVPVISTSVMHVNHPPRSFSSIEDRNLALKRNVEERNRLLSEKNYYFHIN